MFSKNYFDEIKSSIAIDVDQDSINDKSNIFIFPFGVKTGFLNNTSNGYKPSNATPEDYTDFSKIFSGKEGVIAQWENSILLEPVKKDYGSYYKKTLQKGNFFKGALTNTEFGTSFDGASGGDDFGNFTSWNSIRNIEIRTTKEFTQKDLFKLYLIPFKSESKTTDDNLIFYISNLQRFTTPNGEYISSKITFENLGDKLKTTGQAIEQFVQFGAPGEGYALPLITWNSQNIAIDFELNPKYLIDRGINTIQIEILGNSALAAPIIYGRPIKDITKGNNNIYPSRRLLMRDTKYPILDILNRNSNPENVYYLTSLTPQITSYYDNWVKAIQQLQNDKPKRFEGWLKSDKKATKETNPSNKTLKDKTLKFTGKLVIDYNFNVGPVPFFNWDSSIGNKSINFSKHPEGTIKDIMNLASLASNHIAQLPIETSQQISWSLKDIFLVGGFLNNIVLGFPVSWRQITTETDITFPFFNGFPFFISKPIYDFYVDTFWNTTQNPVNPIPGTDGLLPFDMFRSKEDKLGGLIGSSSTTTSFAFGLTDKINAEVWSKSKKIKLRNETVSTLMLGQENKSKTDEVILANNSMTTLDPIITSSVITDEIGSTGYIIDAIGFVGLTDAPIRITCFSDDPDQGTNPYESITWQTTLNTDAGFTNNTRNWRTIYKTSYLDDFIPDGVEFEWPKPLPTPDPKPEFANVNISTASFAETLISSEKKSINNYDYWDYNYDKTYLIYDFKNSGLSDVESVKKAFDKINIPEFLQNELKVLQKRSSGPDLTYSRFLNNALISVNIENIPVGASNALIIFNPPIISSIGAPSNGIPLQDYQEINNGQGLTGPRSKDWIQTWGNKISIYFDATETTKLYLRVNGNVRHANTYWYGSTVRMVLDTYARVTTLNRVISIFSKSIINK